MGAVFFYEEVAPDLDQKDGRVRLEVAELGGRIVIGLGDEDDVSQRRRCSLDKAEARKVLEALDGAISRIAYLP